MRFNALHRMFWAGLLAALLVAAPAFAEGLVAAKAAAAPDRDEQRGTTLNDQVDLAVTVYNSNIALVRDVRQLTLPAGEFHLRFMDIAASINPATVHFRSLTEPSHLAVVVSQ